MTGHVEGGSALGPITDFVWHERRGPLAAAEAQRVQLDDVGHLWGQFALHARAADGRSLLVRDRLGVNKLFFCAAAGQPVESANSVLALRRRGHALGDIWSVPAGHAVELCPARDEYRLFRYGELAYGDDPGPPRADLVAGIASALAATFARLAELLRGRRLFVTLSGGLDSTVIATLVREHLGAFTAVTFTADDDGPGSDLAFARVAAERLRVPLEVVRTPADRLVELLDAVLVHGQDWRDFNVHCGLVNAAIAASLRQRLGPAVEPRPVVLTGDGMNELLADYTPVEHAGVRHYDLPRLPPGALRRFLVAGLDSGDREVGIFHAHGFDVVQPYLLAAAAYTALPGGLVAAPRAKADLVQALMGDRIPRAIYDRPKVRAQVGSSERVGGTLAALVARGIDAAWLERRFEQLLDVDPQERRNWIRAGQYRHALEAPWRRGGR